MRGSGIVASCLAVAVIVGGLPGAARAAGPYSRITGTGSSFVADAVNDWAAQVRTRGMQVDYTATGSTTGRRDFAGRVNDFAVTDLPFRGFDPISGQRDTTPAP